MPGDDRRELSGVQWCARFPQSRSVEDLDSPFRENVQRFLAALAAAGASVRISTTYRPSERAYLMHYAGAIAFDRMNPESVPRRAGVNIEWVHRTANDTVDLAASRRAARAMAARYEIAYPAALQTRHFFHLAIDMTITWGGTLRIRDGENVEHALASTPRTGSGNTALHAIGRSYGVIKLVSDPPHWSDNGH
jgi:hypothetical protein